MSIVIRRVLFICALGFSILAISRAADPSISITISTPRPIVPLGAELRIKIVLKNISSHPIDFSRSPSEERGEDSHEVEVRDEQGNKLPETKYYRVIRGKEADDEPRPNGQFSPPRYPRSVSWLGKTIEPGGTFPDGLILNKLIDIRVAGKYTVMVRRLDEETKSFVSSNTITLTVTK